MPPVDSGRVAQCVANAPGGPTHVLTSDREAEHIPGCNMAIRKDSLQRIDGFDPQFRAAGDDVNVCWRILENGERIAFSPGAVVHHHRRATVRGYLRQQRGYGRAEALLERKHPDKYSPTGHVSWSGRLYGNGSAQHRGGWRWRVYYGGWGTAAFQPLYGPRTGLLESLPLMPEWYLAIALLALLSAVGAAWMPALLALPLLVLAIGALVSDAALGAARARFGTHKGTWRLRLLTGFLYLAQPLARLDGRLRHGLTPWRRRGPRALSLPVARNASFWCEHWQGVEERVRAIADELGRKGAVVCSGGDWDRWDLQVRGGLFGVARLRIGIEEHGGGAQLVRVRAWPRPRPGALAVCLLAVALATLAGLSDGDVATVVLAALAGALLGRLVYESCLSLAAIRSVLPRAMAPEREPAAPAVRTWRRHPEQALPATNGAPEPAIVESRELAEQLRVASYAQES